MSVTLPAPMTPAPFVTVHDCVGPVGCTATVTLYGAPLGMPVTKVKAPSAPIDRSSPPLFWSTSPLPASPPTVPPTVKSLVLQLTTTLVTLPSPTVPEPLPTVQACVGPLGCVRTVTLKVAPLASAFGNVKAPSAP